MGLQLVSELTPNCSNNMLHINHVLHYSALEDYMATTEIVTFSPGMTSQTVSVQTVTDSLIEGDETFSASLSLAAANSDRINLVDNIATTTIQDSSGKSSSHTLAAAL